MHIANSPKDTYKMGNTEHTVFESLPQKIQFIKYKIKLCSVNQSRIFMGRRANHCCCFFFVQTKRSEKNHMKNRHNNGVLSTRNFKEKKERNHHFYVRILCTPMGICVWRSHMAWTSANDETSCTVSNFPTWFAYENCHRIFLLLFGASVGSSNAWW